MKHCLQEADGNEAAFHNAIKVRIQHYTGNHADCYWENHKETPISLLTIAACKDYEVYVN
ncbi:MAG: hypothetical protein MUF43_05765 [Flavobacterium sp.]|nr:hypothetical protein [Flavobacterium sp.]